MSKQSKDSTLVSNIRVSQFTRCCGIGVINNIQYQKVKREPIKDYWSGEIKIGNRYYPVKRVSNKQAIESLKKAIKDGFFSYGLLYIALPDNTNMYKQHLKIIKDRGWKFENKTKSNHGDYMIHVYSMTKEQWKKVRKLYAV